MVSRWPLLLLCLAAAVAVWWIVGDLVDAPQPPGEELEIGPGEGDEPEADPLPGGAPDVAAAPEEPVSGRDPETQEEPDKAPAPTTGGLEVRVKERSGLTLTTEGVSVRVVYVDRPDLGSFQGEAEEGTTIFRFRDLPPGPARAHAEGDLVRPAMVATTIRAGATNRATLAVRAAAALRYDVQFRDRSRPTDVRLTLIDASGEPVRARYRPETVDGKRVRAQHGRTVRMPPQGVVFGLPEGTYTLQAVAGREATGETTITVLAGSATSVVVPLDR